MPAFRVVTMNHPSHHVPDLPEAQAWFTRVFGRETMTFEEILGGVQLRSDWPRDYAMYTLIGDVLMSCVDPQRFVVDGVQQYETVTEPRLKDFGWYVDGLPEAFRGVKAQGFRITNTLGELQEGDEAANPEAPFFTLREDTGLRYHVHSATRRLGGDPRVADGWVLPPVADTDPLGIERCSHHTVLTAEPQRALRLMVDGLGGEVVHQGRDELRATTSTYVHLGDATVEYAIPDPGTAAHEAWARNAPDDTYYALTWKVADVDRAERHLRAQGVEIGARGDGAVVTDPATSLGIPWGFTDALITGDPRGER